MNKHLYKNTLTLLCLSFLLLLFAGCMQNFLAHSGIPNVAVVAHTPATSQIPAAGMDAHFVYVNDYFVLEQPLGDQSYVYTALGRMLTAPSATTDNDGKFSRTLDNQEIWTKYYAKTRIAITADMVIDKEVIFLNYTDNFGNHRAPESSSEAQNGWWLKAKITDVSEMHKGFVTVSGGYRVNLNAMRVAV